MSQNSDFLRLGGCPNCGSRDFRPLTPLAPEVEAYKCKSCNHKWSK